ncbi:MAG: UDP-N-acetylmuramate dehydrogenase [Thermoanaerobaculia bacterium]
MAIEILEQVPLAPFTTLEIGGPARYFARASAPDDVAEAIEWCRSRELPLFVLGGGSNLLIADSGYDGLVLHIESRGVLVETSGEIALLTASAGEEWDAFVDIAVSGNWAGVECLSGIPGSVGATPIQNVGAYGQEVSETVVRVDALDRQTLRMRSFTNDECRFGYRASLFKNLEPDRWIVLSVTYALRPDGEPSIKYPDLKAYLTSEGIGEPSLRDVRRAVLAVRAKKGMVLDPLDSDTRSAGSFFMNPVIDQQAYQLFLERARASVHEDARIPAYPAGAMMKLSAAWLIENAGFTKGESRGRVGLSTKHALAIVNRGGARAEEVVAFVTEIQERVRETFGVEIRPEPNFVGF